MASFRRITNMAETLLAARTGQTGPSMGAFYAHVKVGPYHEVFSASEVGDNARVVMQHAKDQVVLVDDSNTTLAFESWKNWAVERRMTDMLEGLIPKGAEGVSDLREVVSNRSLTYGLTEEFYNVFTTKERQPRPDFTATDVHRRYRMVLDAAKERPVFVGHKNEMLAVDLWERRQFDQTVAAVFHDVFQFHQTRDLARDSAASRWAAATPYPWLAPLPDPEIEQFARDLFPHLLESVRTENFDSFFGNLDGWQTAAYAHGDTVLRKALAEVDGLEKPVAIERPEVSAEPKIVEGIPDAKFAPKAPVERNLKRGSKARSDTDTDADVAGDPVVDVESRTTQA